MTKSAEIQAFSGMPARSGRGGRRFESCHSDHVFPAPAPEIAQVAAQVEGQPLPAGWLEIELAGIEAETAKWPIGLKESFAAALRSRS